MQYEDRFQLPTLMQSNEEFVQEWDDARVASVVQEL